MIVTLFYLALIVSNISIFNWWAIGTAVGLDILIGAINDRN